MHSDCQVWIGSTGMISIEESGAEAKNHDDYINSPPNELPRAICVVCGDLSDGPHFGVNTCRACAAFFRRTVSLKLEYTCRAQVVLLEAQPYSLIILTSPNIPEVLLWKDGFSCL
uniref:Nuclear receptor domain-containing protein n=1 Tax=Parascaris equorum TaxID=6256 RepID=A0A914S3G5_PAREQ